MNKGLFSICLSVLACGHYANATDMTAQRLDFSAPIVQNHATLPGDTPFGAIVFDSTNNAFMGLSSTGQWHTMTSSGANVSLSNLASTAVNADILPATNNAVSLGNTSGKQFLNIAASCGKFNNDSIQIGSCGLGGNSITNNLFVSSDGNSAITFLTSGSNQGIQLTSGGGGRRALHTNQHVRYIGNAPFNCTTNANAGSTASCGINGRDPAGKLTVTTAGSSRASGEQVKLQFTVSYQDNIVCSVTPTNAAAGAQQYYITYPTGFDTGTGFFVNFVSPGADGATFTYDYHCVEVN